MKPLAVPPPLRQTRPRNPVCLRARAMRARAKFFERGSVTSSQSLRGQSSSAPAQTRAGVRLGAPQNRASARDARASDFFLNARGQRAHRPCGGHIFLRARRRARERSCRPVNSVRARVAPARAKTFLKVHPSLAIYNHRTLVFDVS